MARLGNITIENARIFFKDFSASGPFAGGTKRTFCVEIPEDMIEALERDGWNLKTREMCIRDRSSSTRSTRCSGSPTLPLVL